MCTGRLLHHDQTCKERVARPGSGECVQVHWYTCMSKQSGNEWAGQGGGRGECVRVHRYTMSKQPADECKALGAGLT